MSAVNQDSMASANRSSKRYLFSSRNSEEFIFFHPSKHRFLVGSIFFSVLLLANRKERRESAFSYALWRTIRCHGQFGVDNSVSVVYAALRHPE